MINFSMVKSIAIPEGEVIKIQNGNTTLWGKATFTNLIETVTVKYDQYFSTSRNSWASFSNGNGIILPIPNGEFILRWCGKLGKPFVEDTNYGRDYAVFSDDGLKYSGSYWGYWVSDVGEYPTEDGNYKGETVYKLNIKNDHNRKYLIFLCSKKVNNITYEFFTDPADAIITINQQIE